MNELAFQHADALVRDLVATVVGVRGREASALAGLVDTVAVRGDTGIWCSSDRSELDSAHMFVDRLHDWIVEELPAHHLPTNWPPCPTHPTSHPMQVEEPRDADQVELWWACPTTGVRVTPLGTLA